MVFTTKMRLPVPLLNCNKGTLRNYAPPIQPHLLHPGVDSTPLIKGYTVCILQTIVFLEYAVQPVDDSAINILAAPPYYVPTSKNASGRMYS